MEPGIHPQPHPSASSSSPYSQSASSSQQYLQIRTDTTVVSSINSSSAADQSSKSASAAVAASSSGPSYEGLCMAIPHSPVMVPVHQPYTTRAQQSQAPHHRTSPKGRSSPHRFAVSNTSMACSSVGDADNLGLHRRHNNPREAYGGQRQNSLGHQLQQQHNHHQTDALPQPIERRSSDVVDAVSRSLNTHNEPELEGLPPMHCNSEDEDEVGGRAGGAVGTAGHATTLYSKGFLIATASAKDSSASRGNDGGGTYIPPHLHDGKEQQTPRDDGEVSLSQASRSRSPLASTSTGISHRLLTADEINERRRASWAASRSVSQVHSAVAGPAAGDNAGSHQKAGNPLVSVQSAHNNLSTASVVSKVSRPAHRQLTKEEANQLIAHRQQQRTAEAVAVAAAAKDVPAQQQQQHDLSSLLANTPNNNQSGILHSASLDSAKPWLLSGDGTQANYFPPDPASTPPVASTSTVGDGGNTSTKPMAFEWLRGTSGGDTGGVGGGASGAGFFSESTVHSWPGVNGWRDSNVVGSSANGVNVSTAIAAFLGAAGGAAGDGGSNGNFNAPAVALARAGQAPGGTSTAAFTWLPNTSNWSPRNQQQQQQQQALFSFVSATPPQVGAVSGGTNPNTWGYSNTAMGFTGGSLRSGVLTFLSSPPTPAALQGVSQERIEECIRQCDGQLVQLRHEREQLVQELQRRLYASADGEKQQQQQQQRQQQHNHADAASWPGALGPGPHAITIPSSLMDTIAVESAMLPRGTATAGTGAIGGGGSAVRQRPLWPFFGDLIVDRNGVAKTLPHGPVDTRELPSPYMEPTMEVDSAEWAGRAPTAAASHQQTGSSGSATVVGPAHQATASTGAVGRSVGNWTVGERSGGRGRRRAETGNQRNNNDGNSNGASSSAGAAATTFNAGGGGHSNNNRCSHDNTPQEQKYLQTDPFSMYMHNKKIATAGVPATQGSSKAAAA